MPASQGLEYLHSIVLPTCDVSYVVPEPRPYVLCSLSLSLFNGEAWQPPASCLLKEKGAGWEQELGALGDGNILPSSSLATVHLCLPLC